MPETIRVSAFFPGVTAERLYRAWLDSAEHSAFTGSAVQVDPQVGGLFSAWDGYIQGTTLQLEPFQLVVQAWRTTDFPPESGDSRLEVRLEEKQGGVQLTLLHSEIPAGQGEDYRQGWEDYYFVTMRKYFAPGEG
jgi:activator of HSP90 ATPase